MIGFHGEQYIMVLEYSNTNHRKIILDRTFGEAFVHF